MTGSFKHTWQIPPTKWNFHLSVLANPWVNRNPNPPKTPFNSAAKDSRDTQ